MIQWQFLGGTDTVTGSKHILTAHDGTRILIDCGMFQGRRAEAEALNREQSFDPASIDAMVLSHAHIDHCGCIPLLAKTSAFRARIHATEATADLLPIMLRDSAHIQEADAAYLNQKTSRRGMPPVEPLYTMADAEAVLPLIAPHPYRTPFDLPGGIRATQVDAGHVLGAALTLLEVPRPSGRPLRIALTFDLGRRDLPLLRDPDPLDDIDVLVTETTYGDRLHDAAVNAADDLCEAVNAALSRGGKVIIPTFALERTQEILYHLSNLRERGRIPQVPVYIDSPMATSVSGVFEKHLECLDEETLAVQQRLGTVLSPPWVTYTTTIDDSKAITSSKTPSITLAASGMCENGRIRHHLKHGIENPDNIVILVGYQAINTLGRHLQNGEKNVRIFGDAFRVRAEIRSLNAFSAHADRLELFRYIRDMRPRAAYLVHGEQRPRESFARLLRDQLGIPVSLPVRGETAVLDP